MSDADTLRDLRAQRHELVTLREDYIVEWKKISDYLLPGRGLYYNYKRVPKRKLTSDYVVNDIARDALDVAVSGIHGNLTSPLRPWFKADPPPAYKTNGLIQRIMYNREQVMYRALSESNFYQTLQALYIELMGFGTCPLFTGEGRGLNTTYYEMLTAGEYCFDLNAMKQPDLFFRDIFMSAKQIADFFVEDGDNLPSKVIELAKKPAGLVKDLTVVAAITPNEYSPQQPFSSYYYIDEINSEELLRKRGFHEFPYAIPRWDVIANDTYGLGPGSKALPDIKRLQEMEKAGLIAAHKSINPPLQAPSRLAGRISTLPDSITYYANPNEKVEMLYQVRFDHQAIEVTVGRVEERILKKFFNDLFLTAMRDPNASPLKAEQVKNQELERLFRLGPIVERLHYELLQPTLRRTYNILDRAGRFEEVPPELAEIVSNMDVSLTSVLAQSQKAMAAQPIQNFSSFVAGMAQYKPEVLDRIDGDGAVDEFADITGVPESVVVPISDAVTIRENRAAQQQAEQEEQKAMVQQGVSDQSGAVQADTAKTMSEAGANFSDIMGEDLSGLVQ